MARRFRLVASCVLASVLESDLRVGAGSYLGPYNLYTMSLVMICHMYVKDKQGKDI